MSNAATAIKLSDSDLRDCISDETCICLRAKFQDRTKHDN